MRTIAKSALLIGALSISFVACKKDKKTVVEEPPVVVTPPPAAVTSYLYLAGRYQGWNAATAPSIHSTDSAGKYFGYINFEKKTDPDSLDFLVLFAKSFDRKLSVATAATPTLGANPALIQSLQVGAADNIKLPTTGIYQVAVDTVSKKIVANKADWGLIGDATSPGAWTTSTPMVFDQATQTFKVTNVALIGGKDIKFRPNNSWTWTDFGTANGDKSYTNGSDLKPGGTNIAIAQSGNYDITLDLSVKGKAKATITKK
jgi:starch-binding outer membrane protein SusE/F